MASIAVLSVTFAILPFSGAIRCTTQIGVEDPPRMVDKLNRTCGADFPFCMTYIAPMFHRNYSECGYKGVCQEEGCYEVEHERKGTGENMPNAIVCCCKTDNCNADRPAIVAAAMRNYKNSDVNPTKSSTESAAASKSKTLSPNSGDEIRPDYCNGQPAC